MKSVQTLDSTHPHWKAMSKENDKEDAAKANVLDGVVNALSQTVSGMQQTLGSTVNHMVENLGKTAEVMTQMNTVMEHVLVQNIAISSSLDASTGGILADISIKNNNMFPLANLLATVSFEKVEAASGAAALIATLLNRTGGGKRDGDDTPGEGSSSGPNEITQTDRLNAHLLGALQSGLDEHGIPKGMTAPPPEIANAIEDGDGEFEEDENDNAENGRAIVVPPFNLNPGESRALQVKIFPTEFEEANGTIQVRLSSPGTGNPLVATHSFGVYLWHMSDIARSAAESETKGEGEGEGETIKVDGSKLRDLLRVLPTQSLDIGAKFLISIADFVVSSSNDNNGDDAVAELEVIGGEGKAIEVKMSGISGKKVVPVHKLVLELGRLCLLPQ